jgi:hypothetical protein
LKLGGKGKNYVPSLNRDYTPIHFNIESDSILLPPEIYKQFEIEALKRGPGLICNNRTAVNRTDGNRKASNLTDGNRNDGNRTNGNHTEYAGCYYNDVCGDVFSYYYDQLEVTFNFGDELYYTLPFFVNLKDGMNFNCYLTFLPREDNLN